MDHSDLSSGSSSESCEENDCNEIPLSSIYTLVDDEGADEDDPGLVYDTGDYYDNEQQPCPGCGAQFKGKTEKGRTGWLTRHIRLHNVQARRKSLCSPAQIVAAASELGAATLNELLGKEGSGAALAQLKRVSSALKACNGTPLFQHCVEQIAEVINAADAPIFLSEERKETIAPLHRLLNNLDFRQQCTEIIHTLTGLGEGTSQFLSSFLMCLKDKVILYRLSKMRERTLQPTMAHAEDRKENVLYVSGWALWKTKRRCWRNIKKNQNSAIFHCIKDTFSENGANAEKISDKKVRSWIDRKNRGEVKNGRRVNGLTVPSDGAFKFFCRLDAHVEAFESRDGLRSKLSLDALLSKVYDDVHLLDLWNSLVRGMEETHQQAFLEYLVNLYRKLIGNAVAKRIVRGLFKRTTVATRTNLKKNPSTKEKKTGRKNSNRNKKR